MVVLEFAQSTNMDSVTIEMRESLDQIAAYWPVESLEGVASVSTSGDVEEKVGVVLRQEKIDTLNKKIQDALDGKFADAEDEIKEQESELAKGKQALEDGQQQLADATSQAEGQLSQGQSEIIKNEIQLDSKLSEVEKQLFYTTGRRTGKLSCCYADGSGDLH